MKIINDFIWWAKELDAEKKRVLALKDKAKEDAEYRVVK